MAIYQKAAALLSKQNPTQSTFYDNDEADQSTNPVFQAFGQQLELFLAAVRKKAVKRNLLEGREESSSKLSNTLFELWNSFENRLPETFLQSKILEVGDVLFAMQEYNYALQLCYSRYLVMHFGDHKPEMVADGGMMKEIFFPDGFRTPHAHLTLRAVLGSVICAFHVMHQRDTHFEKDRSITKSSRLLSCLQRVTEAILPIDSLCWAVYNATVHIYSISRILMSVGQSALVLDYLLWASICMETSLPLVSVKYLPWRSTLYTAVCQCYNDCKRSHMSEAFARRANAKINELSELMKVSSMPPNNETEAAFRVATVKMAVIIFKRAVFETRKRPKGVLRPKQQNNLKEVAMQVWPRTATERLLVSVCQGSAAQALGILEALSDSNRRTLVSAAPTPVDMSDTELLDVYTELFMAAQEIIYGGGGSPLKQQKAKDPCKRNIPLDGVVHDKTLMEMAAHGFDGVPVSFLIKLVKWSFCYQQWEFFDVWLPKTLALLEVVDFPGLTAELKILQAFDKAVMSRSKQRKQQEDESAAQTASTKQKPSKSKKQAANAKPAPVVDLSTVDKSLEVDDLLNLAEVLLGIVNSPLTPQDVDTDMVIDAAVVLWNKTKAVFHRCQNGILSNPKFLERIDSCGKWVEILEALNQIVRWCDLDSVDPAMASDINLRLALIFEAAAVLKTTPTVSSATRGLAQPSTSSLCAGDPLPSASLIKRSITTYPVFDKSPSELLEKACSILEAGIRIASRVMNHRILHFPHAVADVIWAKEFNMELFDPVCPPCGSVADSRRLTIIDMVQDSETDMPLPEKHIPTPDFDLVWELAKDFHIAMIFHYHRICLRLVSPGAVGTGNFDKGKVKEKWQNSRALVNTKANDVDDTGSELENACRSNRLSLAMHYLQRAKLLAESSSDGKSTKKFIDEAVILLKKYETEEKKLYRENVLDVKVDGPITAIHAVPPPPVLLSRTDSVMVFKATPFRTVNGEQIMWYRLFGRIASGADVKARLNDYNLPGTGELVAAQHGCKFYVSGLVPNERYTFALAAYTASGELIGNAIGESTKPILASPPMNLVMCWCYMCVVCNQLGFYQESREAFNAIWSHFIDFRQCPPSDWQQASWLSQKDFTLTLYKLNESILERTSSILQRMLSLSIFAGVEATVMDEQLYCDALCEFGPVYRNKQLRRLALCEKLMPVMQLAALLNDTNMALQAVVECYGLLASLIHFKIPSTPVVQVLLRCITVLQEIPGNPRRSSSVAESLMHMIACCSYHLSKVLRSRHELELADRFNEIGRRLLSPNYDPNRDREVDVEENSMLDLAAEEKPPKGEQKPQAKNPELLALEQSIQKISKQPSSGLSGNEDMNVLTGYIKFVPSAAAYAEVKKFKKRPGYLQFLVQVAQKALSEGNAEQVITWCADAEQTLVRRNEDAYGQKTGIGKLASGAILTTGEDGKSFQAALIEYSKEQAAAAAAKQVKGTTKSHDGTQGADKGSLHKDTKKDMTAQKLQTGQDPESKARFIMRFVFLEYYRTIQNWRKNRAVVADERPWRSQLNLVQGLSHLGILFNKLETMNVATARFLYRPSFLDQEWFTLDAANTMISDYTGLLHPRIPQPIQPSPTADESPMQSVRSQPGGGRDKKKQQPVERPVSPPVPLTAIELAAKSVMTEIPPVPATSRTARQEVEPQKKKGKNAPPEEPNFISRADIIYFLRCTFVYISRAAVLAHRGRHWTLLQNVCHDLLNSVELAMVLTHTPDKNTGGDLLSLDDLKTILCRPMYMAADLLLDMLQQTENHLNDAFKTCNDGDASKPVKPWYGELIDEQGGAGTHFDVPYDDVSTVDVRCVKCVVMTSLELLFHELKWEKLVDIGLRFNALSGYRHTEVVTPLIIHAQHKLIQRITENGGKPGLQPHFKAANKGKPISATDYLTLQLEVPVNRTADNTVQKLEPGALIDPREHIPYSATRALQLSSVPLDVTYSLQSLRAALGEAQFSARSLQNSRRLLVLYLAGRTSRANQLDLEPHNDVNSTKLKATSSQTRVLPPDLSTVDFRAVKDVTNRSLERASITAVISSYEKTIETLASKGRKGLKAEALRELGNVYYHAKNTRSASKCWNEALDTLLNATDVLNKWRSVFQDSTDIPRDMLQKCGLWGCLLGGIISSNIAQYILSSDLSAQCECCILSGNFFKAIFRTSLPHPLRDCDYALYDVGDYCEVVNLVPGVDLLSEKFRADGRTVVAAVRFVADVLTRSHYSLFVLPLLTLYQFWATCVCRDVYRSVDCRIIRLSTLINLGFYSQAFTLLHRIMNGEHLPQLLNSQFRLPEATVIPGSFNTQLPLVEEGNMTMLEFTMDRCLSSTLGSLYGPQLTCRLALAQAHLLTSIAATIPVIPSSSNIQVPEPALPSTKKASGTPTPSSKAAQKAPKLDVKRKSFDRLTEGTAARDIALDSLKSLLLSHAEHILVSMSDSLTNSVVASGKGLSEMTASELEIIVLAKLELSSISVQHHHTIPASQLLLDALNLLKNATVLSNNPPPAVAASTATSKSTVLGQDDGAAKSAERGKPDITSSSLYQLHNLLSRCHLDARLWLECRRSLVRCLLAEVKGFGDQAKKGSGASQSVDDYCRDGLAEAELFGDIELQAEFLFYGAILFIVNGKPVHKALTILQEVNKMLSGLAQLSVASQLLLVNVRLHLVDLESVIGDVDGIRTKYFELQELLLSQAESLGEDVESHCDTRHRSTSSIASPIKNIYLSHLSLLVQVKLRIGQALASSVILSPSECVSLWSRALGVLRTAFELNKVIASRNVTATSDLLLLMGQIQRQLFHRGQYPARAAAQTLIQAINTSLANEHDLSLIRKAYIELALIYMASSGLAKLGANHVLEPLPEDPPTTEKQKQRKSQEQVGKLDEHTAAWLAVSCAAACVKAQLARNTLTSTTDTLTETLGSAVTASLPDFLALDLVGLQSTAITDEKVEDTRPNTDALQSSAETYNSELRNAKQATADVAWLNIIDYQSKLQRMCSTSVLNTTNDPPPAETSQPAKTGGSATIPVPINECTLLDNPRLESAMFDGTMGTKAGRTTTKVAIRYLPFTEQWLPRFGSLHSLLSTNIPTYSGSCQAVQPPTSLNLSPVEGQEISAMVVSRDYSQNQITKLDGTRVELKFSSVAVTPQKPDEAVTAQSKEGQLSTLWFQPSFDQDGGESDLQTMLLYSFAMKANKKSCGMRWVLVSQLHSLHNKLSTLAQNSEPAKQPDAKSKKKSNTVLAPSEADEKFMLLLEECLTEIAEMLSLPISDFSDVPPHESRHVHTSLSTVQPSAMSTMSTVQPLPSANSMMASNKSVTVSNRSLAVSNMETILSVMKSRVGLLEQMFRPGSGVVVVDVKLVSWMKLVLTA